MTNKHGNTLTLAPAFLGFRFPARATVKKVASRIAWAQLVDSASVAAFDARAEVTRNRSSETLYK